VQGTHPDRVRCAGFEFDLKSGELRGNGRTTRLAEKPYRLLAILVENAGEVVTREEIQHKLWPNDTIIDFEHGINSAINFLRRAFDDSAETPKYIETIPRHGYRFIAPVEPINAPHPQVMPEPPADTFRGGETNRRHPGLLVGRKVSHYRVLELIGGGGMGLVYRAEDMKLGRAVALKFLPEEMADDASVLQRFEREARAASALNNPHICTIYEFGDYESQPFIVMELLEGDTLRERLSALAVGKSLALNQLLEIALQICDGLSAAHQKNIIHRDIKPANIFLTKSGLAKILDFGLAKPAADSFAMAWPNGFETGPLRDEEHHRLTSGGDPTATRTGVAMGSEGYMSPEQIRGEKLDARTDIFSFGLVLYEMATGRRAFTGETSPMVRKAILNEAVAPVEQFNSEIPAKLVTIIEKALEKDPERRWRTAEEMRTALDQISNRAKARTLKRWIWLAIAAVLSMVAVTFASLYIRSDRAVLLTDKDTVVLGDFANNTTDPVFADSLRLGLQIQLSQSPYLNILPDNDVNKILTLIGRHPDDKLADPVAREVCKRSGSKAFISGSIATVETEYVLQLKAVNCVTGKVLVQQQSEVAGKEKILGALDSDAAQLRLKLGESLASVQRLNLPLTYVTTPSLEALQAYAQGLQSPSPESSPPPSETGN